MTNGQTFSSKEERLEWWKDARFGMFIHWGTVSLKGSEIGWSGGDEILMTCPGGTIRSATSNIDRFAEYIKNQTVEIISNYGQLLVMWYDVPMEFDAVYGQGVIDYIRKVQPDILVNNSTGAKIYYTCRRKYQKV